MHVHICKQAYFQYFRAVSGAGKVVQVWECHFACTFAHTDVLFTTGQIVQALDVILLAPLYIPVCCLTQVR